MKLTSYLIQKRIRSLLAQADKRQPTFCPLSEASNILLLYHIADEEQLKPGISRLQQLHKTIHRGIYLPKGEQQPDETPRTFFLSEENGFRRVANSRFLPTRAVQRNPGRSFD